ncbi:cytochrome o ubiquinol oxidase subunit III [Paenibacillus yanchengensis]|uniref:Cytochrome bo(3) ubiquinol oxidase subunit 3 n=1 Tax=Paenibacillus yanchengensis TaxID=2035833 RepID=A0ABW4YKC8_9BACL
MSHSKAAVQATTNQADAAHEEHIDMEEVRTFGFWIYLMTDIIIFGVLFATFIVLRQNYDGGPTPKDLIEIGGIIVSTFILLTSSYTSGLAVLSMNKGNKNGLIGWLAVTALLGASFLYLEISEFVHLVNAGASIGTSAYWSSFFTLVGTHGIHIVIGLIWMIGIIIQISKRGITPVTKRKVNVISLFWHFLDIVWIFVLTLVYLLGVS